MAAGLEMEMSKTYQYRKVMKPMLERKRRARINKCLDELKDLMITTLESEGEHVTRLEKADILELTVSHLQKLKEQKKLRGINGNVLTQTECFRTGYIYAANEVSRTLAQIPGVNVSLGTQLMTHLGQRLNQIQPPSSQQTLPPPPPPPTIKIPTPIISFNSGNCCYSSSIYSPSSSSSSSSSSPSASIIIPGQLSPMSSRSSYTGSPQPTIDSFRQTELMMTTTVGSNGYNNNRDQDDNVWRPW